MFYPKCPKCGAATETVEPDDFERGSRAAGYILNHAAHQHPYLRMVHLAAKLGREVYKRVPGGGEKCCTNSMCGHRFC